MLPYPWRLSISVARVALGIVCIALQLFFTRSLFSWGLPPILGFFAYSLYALRRSMETDGAPLLTLSIDTNAFLLWVIVTANAGFGGELWAAAALTMYVFLLACAILNHEWWRVLPGGVVCLLVVIVDPAPATALLIRPMIFCSLLAAVWVLHRRHLEARLARASKHSVMYRFEAQQAREEERQRIAADFHDGPLQSFIGLQMRLEIVKKMLARDAQMAAEELRQLQELCKSQVGELRAFVRSMRPADVEGASLGASISRMVEQFQKDTGISTSFLSTAYFDATETEVSLEVLQIVREALNNVQKHSRASRVAVGLNRNGDFLEISVDDNGSGFPFSGSYSLDELDLLRLGPLSIRRRVRALRGQLNVESKPGQGAGLRVRVAMMS
jgi:signal transduction histidine kinase